MISKLHFTLRLCQVAYLLIQTFNFCELVGILRFLLLYELTLLVKFGAQLNNLVLKAERFILISGGHLV